MSNVGLKGRRSTVARASVLAGFAFGLLFFLVGCGWAIAAGHTKSLLIASVVVGLGVVAFTQRGALIGLLLLAAMNGVPFFDTSRLVTSKLAVEDVAVLALILVATAWILLDGGGLSRPTKAGRLISRSGVPLLLWCLLMMTRSINDQHVPVLRALYFGRDFIYFALLLMVLPHVRLRLRDIHVLLGVLAAGVCLFAVGQIMIATGLGRPGNLIHFHYTLVEAGETRVYSNMTDLVTAGLSVSLAAVFLARRRATQLMALPIMVLLTVSTAVQLTRARWIGVVVGFAVASVWLILASSSPTLGRLRKRLSVVLGTFVFAGVAAAVIVPSLLTGGTVTRRLGSIFTDIQTGGGTLAVREAISKTLTGLLGGQWPIGLGFIPPFSHYYFGLPGGSIRNPDVGVLNAVMTIGVLGAMMIYFPVVVVLIDCMRRLRTQRATNSSWLSYGGAIWIVATLASSVTLITLFSPSGLAFTAVFLVVLSYPALSGAQRTVSETRPEPGSSSAIASPRRYPLTT